MVQDISGLMREVNKEAPSRTFKYQEKELSENPLVLEDFDDYQHAYSPPTNDDLNLIIKTYERKNSLGKNFSEYDSSEKKLERQNSRKKNLLENSGVTSGRRQSVGVMASSEEPPANLERQNRF
jgi:hypothetical protein